MNDHDIKKNVRHFYDQVGWQQAGENAYQNAQYEDLRPVSADYIHRCHLRVNRHISPTGRYLLDAGSGPVQYPEYLTYSEGYQYRVCMDISIVALREARQRLGEHGLYVVGDIAHLPFKSDVFDGIVSLHTIHHVPMDEKLTAYDSLYRTLRPGREMTVVEGWTQALLTEHLRGFMSWMRRLRGWWLRRVKHEEGEADQAQPSTSPSQGEAEDGKSAAPAGTFVKKLDAEWLTQALQDRMPFEIFVWRSVSVSFLRSVIYPDWGGKFWLKLLYALEEVFPRWLGRIGQYPLVVISKPVGGVPMDSDATHV